MSVLSLHRNLRIRLGVQFVNRMLDSMIFSFFAIYLATSYGMGWAGVLLVGVVLIAVAGTLAGGHLADVYGRRITLLVAEAAGCVTFAVMAAADAGFGGGTLLVLLAYAVNKFAGSVALPANDAMIVDVTTPENRRQVYTVNYWVTNLALAIGAVFGGFLYDGYFALVLAGAAAATGGIAVVTMLLLAETKPEQAPGAAPERAGAGGFLAGYWLALRDNSFVRFMIAATLAMGVEFQLVNYISIRLAAELPSQNLFSLRVDGVQLLGFLRSENTVLVVLLALVSHRVFRALSDRFRLYVGVFLFIAGYMVLAVSNVGWVLLVAAAVFTVGELMNVPVKQTLLANMVPDHARTRYMAVYNLRIRMAQLIAALSITLGALVPSWTMAVLYGLAGVVIIQQYRVVLARRDRTMSTPAAEPAGQAQG